MKTIWKFPLPVTDEIVLRLPQGAEPLCAQAQDDRICVWALVDPDRPLIKRVFVVRGTGHECDTLMAAMHIDTVQMRDGLVWHVFDWGEIS